MPEDSIHGALERLAGKRPVADPAEARRAVTLRVRRHRRRRVGAVTALAVFAGVIGSAVALSDHPRRVSVTVGPRPAATVPVASTELVVLRNGRLQVIEAGSGAVVRTVPGSEAKDWKGPIALDPTGRTAYVIAGPTTACGSGALIRVDLTTGATSTVAHGAADPAVSPDGRRLAWVTDPQCSPSIDVRRLASGGTRTWSLGAAMIGSLAWASDSRGVAFTVGPAQPVGGLEVLDTDRPVTGDNPTTVASKEPGGRQAVPVDSAVFRDDRTIVGIEPYCPDGERCAGAVRLRSTLISTNVASPRPTVLYQTPLVLDDLVIDPTGIRLAATAGGTLYDLTSQLAGLSAPEPVAHGSVVNIGPTFVPGMRPIAHRVVAAAWLPAFAPASTEGVVRGSIERCSGLADPGAGSVAGTVVAIRGALRTSRAVADTGQAILPTDVVAGRTVTAGHPYRFSLPPGRYVLEVVRTRTGSVGATASVRVEPGRTVRADEPDDCK